MSIEEYVEQAIREVLPKQAKFRILTSTSGGDLLRVNIFPSEEITRDDPTLKSLAIDLATAVTEKNPEINVVMTSFQNGNRGRSVKVNRSDLTALATGSVNRTNLLQSMQISDVRVTRCATRTRPV